MSEVTSLGELARQGRVVLNDGYRTRADELGVPGVPILRVAEVQDGFITPSFGDHVHENFRPKFAAKTSAAGDIVVTTKGTVGRVALMREDHPEFVYSPQVCFFRCIAGSGIAPEWLYFWFKGPEFIVQALGVQSQTDMAPYINLADMRSTSITVPPMSEQQAIAGVLGALDDKIESNRRLVDTLRSLIDAEFMAMFGDAQLVGEISMFAAVVDCLHSKKPERVEHGNQLLQLSNISNDGFLVLGNHYPISHSDYARWTANIEVNEGDLVLTNVGRVGALARIPTGVKAALGRNMTAIRGHSSHEQNFLFASLNNEWVRREMIKLVDVGTIMDALNVHAIRRIKVPEASESQLLDFSDVSTPLIYRAERAIRESDELSALRDALLPALLSGRLRVHDVEKVVEEAV